MCDLRMILQITQPSCKEDKVRLDHHNRGCMEPKFNLWGEPKKCTLPPRLCLRHLPHCTTPRLPDLGDEIACPEWYTFGPQFSPLAIQWAQALSGASSFHTH